MANDLVGLLTGISSTQQPMQPMQPIAGTPGFAGMFGAQQAQGLASGLGRIARQGAPSNQERMQEAVSKLYLGSVEGLSTLAKLQQIQGDLAGASQTVAKIKKLQEESNLLNKQQTQAKSFTDYVASTFKNPELSKLAASGVLTPQNLNSFIEDKANATMLKGSTFTVRDSEGNNFTMIPTLNNKTGKLENSYSPIGDAPVNPVGKTIITGGEFAQTAGEAQQQKIQTKGLETQEAKFQQLKVAATDSIPNLNASKANLDRASTLLDSVQTGGPVNLAGTGLENFFGVKGANKAELEIILGQEMYKSLKPLFGGVISDPEREAIEGIYANLRKGNVANKGILKRLKQELDDGILKARLYQKADNYAEFNETVGQMFPEKETPEKRVIVFGQGKDVKND